MGTGRADELADMFALGEARLPETGWELDEFGQFSFFNLRDLDAITELAAQLASDVLLAEHRTWQFSTDFAATGNQGSHGLQSSTGLTSTVADAWREAVSAVDALEQVELDNLHLLDRVGPGNSIADPPPRGSVYLSIDLNSEAAGKSGLETGELGAELHRLVESTVPILADFPHGSRYLIDVWVGMGDDRDEVTLVDIESGEKDGGGRGGTIAGHARALLDEVD